MIAFGPVPSRRLGKSLGINNIPAKTCSYSCTYCQVGKTNKLTAKREEYYKPEDIFGDVQELVTRVKKQSEKIDYLTFVADGEPTIDINLGHEIDLLRLLDYKIAILTNGSLMTEPSVRDELMKADYVSIKLDTTEDTVWKKINRPCRNLNLGSILEHVVDFSTTFHGKLTTETMLIDGINTRPSLLQEVSLFISSLNPYKTYLAIPTRPTAENGIKMPDEATINLAFQIFNDKIDTVEYLIDYEGDDIGFSGDIENDLLNIASVHPLKLESVEKLLEKADANWRIIEQLLSQKRLREVEYAGSKFYMRSLENPINAGER
jgi:wyosine [tRNA(Phe)-imidazoG37] synthetase (radical SAM superfamily)